MDIGINRMAIIVHAVGRRTTVLAISVLRYLTMRKSHIQSSSDMRSAHNTFAMPRSCCVMYAINSKFPSCILTYEPVLPCSF